MRDREGAVLVVLVFLVGVVERLQERFLLVLVVLGDLGLGQVVDRAIGHGILQNAYAAFACEIGESAVATA